MSIPSLRTNGEAAVDGRFDSEPAGVCVPAAGSLDLVDVVGAPPPWVTLATPKLPLHAVSSESPVGSTPVGMYMHKPRDTPH